MASIVLSEHAERWASFVTYPPTLLPTPYQLCVSGFTSTQNPDIPSHVHCIHCGLQFYGFKPDENAYRKHCEYSPTCPWVLTVKERLASKASIATSSVSAKPTPKAVPAVAAIPTIPSTPQAVLTPPATPPPTSEPALVLTPPATSSKTAPNTSLPDTPPATPNKPISWAEIASRPVVAPKPSRLPVFTPRITPKAVETASAKCPPTPPHTPPQTSASKHQKPYLTIDDLFKMFDGKPKRMNLLHSNQQAKKHASSPCVSHQAKITSYFKPAANQNALISQGSKTPNPRSFQQLIPAEAIRAKSTPPTETMPEKSVGLPYKMPSISDGIPFTPTSRTPLVLYPSHALNQGRKLCTQWTRPQQVSQSEAAHYQGCEDFVSMHGSEAQRIFAGQYVGRQASKITPHTCRRCFRAFRSNNDLHDHLRCTHLEFRRRLWSSAPPLHRTKPP